MMKRSLTIATALLLCAASAASAQDKDKKDKNRDRPPASQPAPQPKPPKQDRPAFQPQPRPAPVAPSVQRQDRPAFQPQPRPAPAPYQAPPKVDRSERIERTRPDRADKPERQDRPDKTARPDQARPVPAERPDRADKPRPQPRPDAAPAMRPDRTRPAHPPRAPRPVIVDRAPGKAKPNRAALPTRPDKARPRRAASPEAVARTRAIHQALKAERRRTFHFRGRTHTVVKVKPYRYPAGWHYRAWRKHQRFPRELFLSAWFLNDFLNYGLFAPPSGYYWVRYGPDAVLVNGSSYDIADTAYGVFDDGSSYGGYDDAYLPPIDPDLPQEFADGSLDMAAGVDQSDACYFFYGDRQTQDDIDAAWADQDWNGLARTVIWAGCGADISYYLLGLAAEGLSLPEAAANYYGRALDMADGDVDSTFKCSVSGPDTCRGLDIGAEASDGLDRIYGPAPQY